MLSNHVYSQTRTLHDPANTTIYNKLTENDPLGLLWWIPEQMHVGELFTTYKNSTGLALNDSMHLVEEWTDSIGCFHHRYYQQYHNGLLVEGAEYREHFNDDYVILSNGWVAENMTLEADTPFSSSEALELALSSVNAEIYAWEDTSTVYDDDSNIVVVDYYPKCELVYALMDDDTVAESKYKLAWRFTIITISPRDSRQVYVDAQTGEVLKNISLKRHGDFIHIYYGYKTNLDTKYIGGLRSKFFLEANDGTRNIRTKDDNSQQNFDRWNYSILPDDLDDHWDLDDWSATSAHYVVQMAWDMFQNVAGRNGMDGKGKGIRVYADSYDPNGPSAQWESSLSGNYEYITFSRGNNTNPMTWLPVTYDIAGHEFAHGVTHYTSRLGSYNESGALDESFSDICGFMTERYAQPNSWDWIIGEDFVSPQLRDMELPSSIAIPTLPYSTPSAYPDWYQSPNWWTYAPEADNGGVHINNSVQNRWFYLLSIGGTQLGKMVAGIGINKSARITYFSYMNLVGQTETYPQARAHAVAAARFLYGKCSFEERQTCKAWSACNIGPYCECQDTTPVLFNGGCVIGAKRDETTQINEIQEKLNTISFYPNPANDELFVSLNEFTLLEKSNMDIRLEIYNSKGALVGHGKPHVNEKLWAIDISSLNTGVYILRLAGNGVYKSFKFIKE
jgi:bacillolysin